jgi:DNA-binding transcriptional ArsR family regulator
MVVRQQDAELAPQRVDRVMHALSDPTRRDIVRRTLRHDRSVSELARRYPMSFAAVQKHVTVLADAGLVSKRRHGREQRVTGDPEGLAVARLLLDDLESVWRARLDRFADVLAGYTNDPPPTRDDRDDPKGTP